MLCLVKVTPGRLCLGPFTRWSQEEEVLFRYFGCPSDAFSHSIEAMRMLPDAAPIHSMLHERGRRRGPSLRAALQLPGPAEAIAHEVPDQLVAWGLPRNGHVPVLHVPQVLLELVLRHSWHTLMWRSARAGGMLLQPVLDFPPVDWARDVALSQSQAGEHCPGPNALWTPPICSGGAMTGSSGGLGITLAWLVPLPRAPREWTG